MNLIKKKHRSIKVLAVILVLILLLGSIPYTRSLIVMKVYSGYEQKHSLLHDKEITVSMPSGDGWYPFVMTFSDDAGFSSWIGEEARLTILYNFPEFDLKKQCSRLYDPSSPYYNSFYGAYAVETKHPYGFDENGSILPEEIAEVPRFDFWFLVLYDFGLNRENRIFDWSLNQVEENVSFCGYEDWTRMEATLKVNGAYHRKQKFTPSYLQYGSPNFTSEVEDLEPVTMKGLIYARWIPEKNTSVFLYCIAMDETIVQETEREILSRTVLRY